MEEAIRTNAPDNDSRFGKDRMLGDLMIKAYEEDLLIWVAGIDMLKQSNGRLNTLTSIPLSGLPIPNAQGLLCYSSPETAKEEPDHLDKYETTVRHLFDFMYVNMSMVGLFVNYNIDEKTVAVAREDLSLWLTPPVRKKLQEAQDRARKAGAIHFPLLY